MKTILFTILVGLLGINVNAQNVDTLKIKSKFFDSERTVYVHTPEFYKYKSEKVKLPVIYILDAQHEWFVQPTLNTIRYLQYTHEIPQAIIVEIPLEKRVKECAITKVNGEKLPLHNFIIEELSKEISAYNVNDFNLIIGHSFSASFALYTYLQAPDFYSAVLSHSPLNKLELLVNGFTERHIVLDKIFLSVGGRHHSKDHYHRKNYDLLKGKYPDFFSSISTLEANESAHNAVPILANPQFLTKFFEKFSYRFSETAKVDENYELIEKVESVEKEIQKIKDNRFVLKHDFAIEIPDINGIASRFWSNDLTNYAIGLYEVGIDLYPRYFEFHWYLGELYLDTENKLEKAIEHLEMSKLLMSKYEKGADGSAEMAEEINRLLKSANERRN